MSLLLIGFSCRARSCLLQGSLQTGVTTCHISWVRFACIVRRDAVFLLCVLIVLGSCPASAWLSICKCCVGWFLLYQRSIVFKRCRLCSSGLLLRVVRYQSEDGGNTFLRNVDNHLQDHMTKIYIITTWQTSTSFSKTRCPPMKWDNVSYKYG
jgi:hypothetical protein